MDEKGQITVWVVVGVLLASSILLISFLVGNPEIEGSNSPQFDVHGFIAQCVRKLVNEAVDAGEDIEMYIDESKIDGCFDDMEQEGTNRGASITISPILDVAVSVNGNMVAVSIARSVRVTQRSKTRTFNNFFLEVNA